MTENLTANHSNATCKERFHVPRMLKNPSVVFFQNRNLLALPQEAKLLNPTHLPLFSVVIKNLSIPLSLCPIPFFSSSSFHVHVIIHFMFIVWIFEYSWTIAAHALNPTINHVHRPDIAEILLLGRLTPTINQSCSSSGYSWTIATWAINPNNQSIN